ncbi:MAG: hypothetical protein ACRDIU_06780 [Actinomycetota bacterium]
MSRKKSFVWVSAGILVLGSAAAVWACSVQPNLIGLTTQTTPPFSEIRVKGQAQTERSTVEIRWNGVNGPLLATVGPNDVDQNGYFSVPITVPEVAPGVYSVVATGPDYLVSRAAVEVVAAAGSVSPGGTTSADLWSGMSPGVSVPEVSSAPPAAAGAGAPGVGIALLAAGLLGTAAAGALALGRPSRARRNR